MHEIELLLLLIIGNIIKICINKNVICTLSVSSEVSNANTSIENKKFTNSSAKVKEISSKQSEIG